MHRRRFLQTTLQTGLASSSCISAALGQSNTKGKSETSKTETFKTPWWCSLHSNRPLKGWYAELPGAQQTWISAIRSDRSGDGSWQAWDHEEFEKLGIGWPGFVQRCGAEASKLLSSWTSKADRTQDGIPYVAWNRHELAKGQKPPFPLPPATALLLQQHLPKSYAEALSKIFGENRWYGSAPSQDFCFFFPATQNALINLSNLFLEIYDTTLDPGTLEIFEYEQIGSVTEKKSLLVLSEI